jgi:transposase
MPSARDHLVKSLFLPELRLISTASPGVATRIFVVEKTTAFEVCPHCTAKCESIYDHVTHTVKDAPLRNKQTILKIRKRRFKCKNCKKIFRESVRGIFKGYRTSQRFRKHVMWCASQFSNLSHVSRTCMISSWFVYKAFYEQIDLQVRKYQTPWPATLGIDEHSFMRHEKYGFKEFATVFVDYNNSKVRELAYGRYAPLLRSDENLKKIPGRENVKNVVLDLSQTFKNFATEMFPNAILTADKFHVVKLLSGAIQKHVKILMNEKIIETRGNPLRKLLLRSRFSLQFHERIVIDSILANVPALREIYYAKEAIMRLYRVRGFNQATRSFTKITDALALSKVKEVKTFRRTLLRWRVEILNYFRTKITNARTEGYNRKAKLIQRNAYGFRNFNNYRLRVLYACR